MRDLATTRFVLSGLICCVGLVLAGCGGRSIAPVHTPQAQQPVPATAARAAAPEVSVPADGYHVVVRGDTLYSIAWRYGQDYRTVARWNNIGSPYLIYPGNRIRVIPPAQQVSPPLTTATPTRQPSPPIPPAGADRTVTARTPSPPVAAPTPSPTPAPAPRTALPGTINWQWPTQGDLLRVQSPTAEKGIKISGRIGQEVKAAAPGQVVYSGSGLIGYGRLIIIKHDDTYLSAYAHNHELLVEEGDSVSAGQQIATMGTGSEGRALLHFEIRRNGQPVDPLQHLPKRKG